MWSPSEDNEYYEYDEPDEIVGGGIPDNALYAWCETLRGGHGVNSSDFTDEDIAMFMLCQNERRAKDKPKKSK